MKTTQSIRLDAKVIEHIKQIWKGNFNKWVELLYESYNTSVAHVWYSEFKEALQLFIEVAKKFKPDPHTVIEEAKLREATLKKLQSGAWCTKSKEELWKDIETQMSKAKLQAIANWDMSGSTTAPTPMDHPLRTAKDYQDAKLLAWKIKIGIKKNHWKMQDNDWFDCTWQKRISFEWCSHLESLIETMI